MKKVLLLVNILILLSIPVNAKELNWWVIPGALPPDMSDTGYRFTPNHAIVCTVHVPPYQWWTPDDYYGGGVGIKAGTQDVRIYAFADREPFTNTPRLGVWHGRTDRINVVDLPRFDMDVQICISYLSDGTVKIAYRYGSNTEWQILHTEVATAESYQVIAVQAYNFHIYSLNPSQPPNQPNQPYEPNQPAPFPTSQPYPSDVADNNSQVLILAGLGLIAILVLLARR